MSVTELVEQSYAEERQQGRQEALREVTQLVMAARFGDAGRVLWEADSASLQNADWEMLFNAALRVTAPEDLLKIAEECEPAR